MAQSAQMDACGSDGEIMEGIKSAEEKQREARAALLACSKCGQFGHLTYQCMNIISVSRGNKEKMIAKSHSVPVGKEETEEIMQKCAETDFIIAKLHKAIQKKKEKKKLKKKLKKLKK